MMESLSVGLTNGDHVDAEAEKPRSPSITIQNDSKNESLTESGIDYMESSSLIPSNYESIGSTPKNTNFSSVLKTTAPHATRKRGFLASDLSNSDKGTFFTTSPSRTSPSHSSSVSSSSPASTGSPFNRDEISGTSKREESEVGDKLIAKRARSTALRREEEACGVENLNSARCTSECPTLMHISKPKYRPRLSVTGKRSTLEVPEISPTIPCPNMSTDDNASRCLNLTRLANRETGKVSVPNSSRVRQPKSGLKSGVLSSPGQRLQKKEIQAGGADEEYEREAPSGSELTIAAYNNFVRRVVDDTLDRNITFCEQPRHAITALENICARAWPTLDMKRHRNRIRAYLKACRRNSKKNQGQINMKEPAMNGLSIEARQLVTNALSLVANEVEHLKLIIQDTSKCGFPPNSSSPGSSKDTIDSHYLVSTPTFGQKHKRADATGMCADQPAVTPDLSNHSTGPTRSGVFDKDFPGPLLPHSSSYSDGLNSQMPTPSYLHSSGPYFSPLSHGLDASYMAVIHRLLPTLMHYNKPYGSTMSQPGGSRLIVPPLKSQVSTKACETSTKDYYSKPGLSSSFDAHQFPFASSFYGASEPETKKTSFSDEPVGRSHHDASGYSSFLNRTDTESCRHETHNMISNLDPPPAHMNSIQYSPSLQEAIGKLLGFDVCLTQHKKPSSTPKLFQT